MQFASTGFTKFTFSTDICNIILFITIKQRRFKASVHLTHLLFIAMHKQA